MVIMLLPNQVGDYWEVIKESLVKSGIPIINEDGIDTYANILTSLLEGKLSAWVKVDGPLENGIVNMIAVCGIITDEFSLTKNLLIYSLWSIHGESNEVWIDGLSTLRKYAKGNNCKYILGYSAVPKMIELGKSFGADTTFSLIKFNV